MWKSPRRPRLGAHVRNFRSCRAELHAGCKSVFALLGLSTARRRHAVAQRRDVDASMEVASAPPLGVQLRRPPTAVAEATHGCIVRFRHRTTPCRASGTAKAASLSLQVTETKTTFSAWTRTRVPAKSVRPAACAAWRGFADGPDSSIRQGIVGRGPWLGSVHRCNGSQRSHWGRGRLRIAQLSL